MTIKIDISNLTENVELFVNGKRQCEIGTPPIDTPPEDPLSTFDFGDGNGPVPAHKHPNGDGWVADTTTVDDTVFVGPIAQVFGNAQVYGNARVSGIARVYGIAQVSGIAQVYGNARVSGNAQVYGIAQVSSGSIGSTP